MKNQYYLLDTHALILMIDATLLPNHHKDPFDRLLIIQANYHNMLLVTKDSIIRNYAVQTFWM